MLVRTITGAFILLFTALFIFLKKFSDLFFDAFVLVVMFACIYETIKAYKIAGKHVDYLIYILPPIFCAINNLEPDIFQAIGFEILVVFGYILYLLTSEIISYAFKRKQGVKEDEATINMNIFDRTKVSLMILAYPVSLLSILFSLNHIGKVTSFIGIILSFAVAMMTDTFAYLFGRLFGKRKFIPEVSPKKTVAGMIGGFVGGIVASLVTLLIFVKLPYFSQTVLDLQSTYILVFSVIGILGAWADQLGDLVASALKRKVGIKDYAHIFPGHGGFMDRVDGLMFTETLIFILFALFLV